MEPEDIEYKVQYRLASDTEWQGYATDTDADRAYEMFLQASKNNPNVVFRIAVFGCFAEYVSPMKFAETGASIVKNDIRVAGIPVYDTEVE